MVPLTCPACSTEIPAHATRCGCGADVTLLRQLDGLPDAWFNRALEALANGEPGRALEWLAGTCVARPTDAAALRALARVWAQLGHPREALAAWERAAELEPIPPEDRGLDRRLRTAKTRRTRRAAQQATA